MYNTLKDYVEANGYKVEDLTKEELKAAEKERQILNNGGQIIDGVFSGFVIALRKSKKEAGL